MNSQRQRLRAPGVKVRKRGRSGHHTFVLEVTATHPPTRGQQRCSHRVCGVVQVPRAAFSRIDIPAEYETESQNNSCLRFMTPTMRQLEAERQDLLERQSTARAEAVLALVAEFNSVLSLRSLTPANPAALTLHTSCPAGRLVAACCSLPCDCGCAGKPGVCESSGEHVHSRVCQPWT